jgi:hypothetical protein
VRKDGRAVFAMIAKPSFEPAHHAAALTRGIAFLVEDRKA